MITISGLGVKTQSRVDEELGAEPLHIRHNRMWTEMQNDAHIAVRGPDFRWGGYDTLDVEDGRVWRDALIVWLRLHSSEPVRIRLWPAGSSPAG